MTWNEADWKEHIEFTGEGLSVSLEGKPENEESKHYRRKLALARFSDDSTPDDVEVTTEHRTDEGIRHDVYYQSGGQRVSCEAGELNTSASEMDSFLERRYRDVDFILWWPYDWDFVVRWLADHRPVCDVCFTGEGELGDATPVHSFPAPLVEEIPRGDELVAINVEHYCEPESWHSDSSNGQLFSRGRF